jgi:hypothetical protein
MRSGTCEAVNEKPQRKHKKMKMKKFLGMQSTMGGVDRDNAALTTMR